MVLDGKIAAENLLLEIKEKVEKYQELGQKLKLCVLQLVNDDASKSYLKGRMKMCEKVGVDLESEEPFNILFDDLKNAIENLKQLLQEKKQMKSATISKKR